MNFKSLQRKAKELVDKRGGTDSLKADAEELKNIAKGPGSVADKAKMGRRCPEGARCQDVPETPATDKPAPG